MRTYFFSPASLCSSGICSVNQAGLRLRDLPSSASLVLGATTPGTFFFNFIVFKKRYAGQWWHTPLIPALGRQRQAISTFKASLVYKVSSRTASRAIQRNPVSKNKTKHNKILKENGVYTVSIRVRFPVWCSHKSSLTCLGLS